MAFDSVDPRQSLPDLETGILKYWREEDIFKRSMARRKDGDVFSFYDGPPFATGLPHYGHILAGTIKDVIPRYQTMRGKFVKRRFGWDCHGLPIENLIEKEHGLKSKKDIEELGVGNFNDLCRGAVQRYTKEWREVVERMGRWVDMDHDYRTMDPEYMESIWWVVKELHKQELIYEGWKPMHICPRCATPLSNFEVAQGYKDRTDQSVIATFPLVDDPKTVILAWTTTSWTLPGNIWLALGPKISYVRVQEKGSKTQYVVAEKLVESVFKGKEYEIVGPISVDELVGKKYQPLFPYFVDTVIPSSKKEGKPKTYGDTVFNIILEDTVADDEGTGIVHMTNSHGEDGFNIAKKLGIDVLHHVTMDGHFVPEVTDFKGMEVKPEGKDPMKTDKTIIEKLKTLGRYFKSYTLNHSYPHCWRCDTPLLNYATSSWFVSVEKLKSKMLESNSKTSWVPGHLRDGRFGKWLEGARDWAISRNRFWGTPLPIWRNTVTGDIEVIGSRDELMQKKPERFTKVFVMRHAESEGNVQQIYQGKVPGTSLTERGQGQAKTLGENVALSSDTIKLTTIYCSPLERTRQTAAAVALETGATLIVDERLREVDFGEYEGKSIDFDDLTFIRERRAHKLETGKLESIYHFQGMETWSSTELRTRKFLDEILPKHKGEAIGVVTHADLVMNFTQVFTGQDPQKIVHQPYPETAGQRTFFWDHERKGQMDLHKETVDEIMWGKENGGNDHSEQYKRIEEVLDCWFESGSMPYAQDHFPFENTGKAPPGFPAEFIAEGLDQTRGWFYTLMVLSTALFECPAFKHCIVNGIVLAEDGKKMSKSLKNYPDPTEVVKKHGADAVRFSLMSSPAVRGEDLRFSEKIVAEAVRSVLLPLWNAYRLFVTYANAASWKPSLDFSLKNAKSTHQLDRWIVGKTQKLVNSMTKELEGYDLSATCSELTASIDDLTNWYIRLSRRRFAGKEDGPSSAKATEGRQNDAFDTLYRVLLCNCQLLAPFCPFITEDIFLNLVGEDHDSIHFSDWPKVAELSTEDQGIVELMDNTRTIVNLGLSLRSDAKIKVRSPLSSVTFALPPSNKAGIIKEIIAEELNVKQVIDAGDACTLAMPIVSVDARKVGPRVGGKVQDLIKAGKAGQFEEKDGKIIILGETLSHDEAKIVYQSKEGKSVAADHGIVATIDTTLTEALILEGQARELIHAVQQLRKDAGLEFTDTVTLDVQGLDAVIKEHGTLVQEETRAEFGKAEGDFSEVDIEGMSVKIRFQKK